MDVNRLIARADELIELGNRVAETANVDPYVGHFIDDALFGEFCAAGLSFIRNVYGKTHPNYTNFDGLQGTRQSVNFGVGILQAVRGELTGGWLRTTLGLLSAQIFTSFIDMAEHLLNEGYKDPAAVMIGSVLEQHLRQLADNNGVDVTFVDARGRVVPKKTDTLNADLVKAGVYTGLDQKQITAWLDLRNKAAHGDYGKYNVDLVKLMHQGVVNFMTRVPV